MTIMQEARVRNVPMYKLRLFNPNEAKHVADTHEEEYADTLHLVLG